MKVCCTLLTVAAAVVLIGCSKNVSQVLAECESEAYAKIGVQADSVASNEYLANKHEFVRSCLVKNGMRFKVDVWNMDAPTFRQAYTGETLQRHLDIAQINSKYWE